MPALWFQRVLSRRFLIFSTFFPLPCRQPFLPPSPILTLSLRVRHLPYRTNKDRHYCIYGRGRDAQLNRVPRGNAVLRASHLRLAAEPLPAKAFPHSMSSGAGNESFVSVEIVI